MFDAQALMQIAWRMKVPEEQNVAFCFALNFPFFLISLNELFTLPVQPLLAAQKES